MNKLSSMVNTKHLHRWKTKNRSQRQESSFLGRSSDMSRNSFRGFLINIVHQMFQMFIQVPISAVCEKLPLRDSVPISGRGVSQHLHWPDWTLLWIRQYLGVLLDGLAQTYKQLTKDYVSGCLSYKSYLSTYLTSDWGTSHATKSDEFSEKNSKRLSTPPSFSENCNAIFFRKTSSPKELIMLLRPWKDWIFQMPCF